MSANHTPGLWIVNPIKAQVDVMRKDLSGPEPICLMLWPTDMRGEDETIANAHLIAAAPKMCAALERVLLEEAPSYHDCLDDGLPQCAWCDAAEALKKARGES